MNDDFNRRPVLPGEKSDAPLPQGGETIIPQQTPQPSAPAPSMPQPAAPRGGETVIPPSAPSMPQPMAQPMPQPAPPVMPQPSASPTGGDEATYITGGGNTPSPTQQPQQPKKSSSLKTILLVVLGLLVVGGLTVGAYFLWFDNSGRHSSGKSKHKKEVVDSNASASEDEISEEEVIDGGNGTVVHNNAFFTNPFGTSVRVLDTPAPNGRLVATLNNGTSGQYEETPDWQWVQLYNEYGSAVGYVHGSNILNGVYAEVIGDAADAMQSQVFPESDLMELDDTTLRLLRNAIFAKHGYIFQSEDLTRFFSQYDWYSPSSTNVTSSLNELEKKNINNLKEREDYLLGL